MGLFSLFCGFIYNDFASIPLNIWGGSCYNMRTKLSVPEYTDGCVYPIGLDPVWYMSNNELAFTNSLKMKTAVIFGVAQMALGIFLKGMNSLYFGKHIDFIFEFIP